MNDTVLFERIALIGIGLIGSSLARDSPAQFGIAYCHLNAEP